MRHSVSQVLRLFSAPNKNEAVVEEISKAGLQPRSERTRTWLHANFLMGALLQVPKFLRTCEVRPVRSGQERCATRQMLYREYRQRNYCAPNPLEQHFNLYSITPACKTLVMVERSECSGTVSVVLDTELGLPLEKLYADEVAALRIPGRRLAEIGLLALDCRTYARGSYSLKSLRKMRDIFSLFRAVYVQSRLVSGVTDLLIVVHPRHENLYRYIGFQPIGQVKSYEGAEGNPALPMRLELKALEHRASSDVAARYLTMDHSASEKFEDHHPLSYSEVLICLSEHPTLWTSLDAAERKHLQKLYPRLAESRVLLDSLHDLRAAEAAPAAQVENFVQSRF